MWIAVKSHRNNSASLIIQHHHLKELESQIIHKTLPWRAWGCLQPWWRPRWRKLRSLRPPAEYEYEDEDNRVGDDDEDKEDKDDGSFIVHLPIFFWVGFRWDCHYGPEMGGMDPKPRPTKPRDFLTYHYFLNGKFKITLNSYSRLFSKIMCWTISCIGKKGKVVARQIKLQFTLTILSLQWVAFMWFTVRIFKSWGKRVLYSFTNCFLFSLQFFQICSVCNCYHSILCLCSPYNPSFWSITKLCLCHSMYLLPVPSISFINYQIFTFLCIPLRFFALLYIVLDFSVFLCILHLIF